MKKILFLHWAIVCTLFVSAQTWQYPPTKTVDSADTSFGVTYPDPYRWLEDIKNPEVETWFKTQADYTNAHLTKISGLDKLISELKRLDNLQSASYMPMAKAGGKYFYQKRLPGEQVYKLYYRQGANGKEVLLFDPQKYTEGKTYDYSLSVSSDGSRVLLNLSEAGTEIGDIRIIDVAAGKLLPDIIPHSGGWFAGGSNNEILYSESKNYDVHDTANAFDLPCKLHVLGTPASLDLLIASSQITPGILPRSEYPYVSLFKDCPYMFLRPSSVEKNITLYYAPISELKSGHIHWKPLTTKADEVKYFSPRGNDFYFLTSKGNPQFKIAKTNLENPDIARATTIAEGKDDWGIEGSFGQTKDYLVFNKIRNGVIAKPYVYEFKTGKLSEINVPLRGNIYGDGFSSINAYGWSEASPGQDNEILLFNSGWTTPLNFYSYDLQSKKLYTDIFTAKYNYSNLENIVDEEVEVTSHDGTLVPLSIVYDKAKLKKDGSNICLMEGYGAYGITYGPGFGVEYLPLLNRGVILARAHVRGGGEKGNDWHIAGKKTTKPNTWKDFNACAEYLIKNKYTSPGKFGITGGSAGGILIGRAVTERPDLYKVAITKVGALNMLRFEHTTNGPANIPEFGTVKDSVEFHALLEMDAYQHIQNGVKYPSQLITTGWNDPRVDSYIPAKFAARMQGANGSQNPVFLDVNYAGGHYGGSTVDERFVQTAKEYAFLLWQCGDPDFQYKK
ncbi:MAG TPA: prolyl oligopeptidase family serine peptidase [Ginsengibacter sp.]|nr:prolyl oligopeptidase family serine peptidase [Ginsengibacter sp.]